MQRHIRWVSLQPFRYRFVHLRHPHPLPIKVLRRLIERRLHLLTAGEKKKKVFE
jgi:hypothetical protein